MAAHFTADRAGEGLAADTKISKPRASQKNFQGGQRKKDH